MKYHDYLIPLLFLSSPAIAADLTIKNDTGAEMRITALSNRCTGRIVTEENPAHLKAGEVITLRNLPPVIHSYTICGSGFCSQSAIALRDGSYTLRAVLEDGVISGKDEPDHWKTANTECERPERPNKAL